MTAPDTLAVTTDREKLLALIAAAEAAAELTPVNGYLPAVELRLSGGGDVAPRPELVFLSTAAAWAWHIDRGGAAIEWDFRDAGELADRFLALCADGKLPPLRRRKAAGA